jgi:hypothetical protein
MAGRDPFIEVPRLLATLTALRQAHPVEVADRRAGFVAAVTSAGQPAEVREPAAVVQPA